VQWSVGANIVRGGLYGLQAAVGANYASTKNALDPAAPLRGWQLGLGANVANGDMRGGQFGAGANVVLGEMRGVQWSAGVSHARRLHGSQLGLVDFTGSGRGAQLGLLNISRGRMQGAQIGIINYAEDADVSIGLIPISRKSGVGGEVWTDDIATINAGLRLRARRSYTILSVGAHPFPKRLGGHLNYGITIGGRIDVHPKVFVDIDVGYRGILPGFREYRDMPHVGVARVLVGARLGRRLAVFGGPSFAVAAIDDVAHPGFRPGYQWEVYTLKRGDWRLRMWPGFAAGLQF
jgi:hypothetical protein